MRVCLNEGLFYDSSAHFQWDKKNSKKKRPVGIRNSKAIAGYWKTMPVNFAESPFKSVKDCT